MDVPYIRSGGTGAANDPEHDSNAWRTDEISGIPADAWKVVAPAPSQISNDKLGYNVKRYDIAALDHCAGQYFAASQSGRDPLLLDLRGIKYIEHECLAHIGAIFADSKRRRRPIALRLPTTTEPRTPSLTDFLRSWQFPEFIQDVTGRRPFQINLLQQDAEAWGNLPEASQFTPVIRSPQGEPFTLLPRGYFALTPIRSLRRPSLAAEEERSRFLHVSFKNVLKELLGDKPGEDVRARQIATQIIAEAVKNAAMHPQAKIAYTSTQIRLPRVEDGDSSFGSLEISVWDNGESVSGTLNQAISSGLPITTSRFGAEEEVFKVTINPSEHFAERGFEISNQINPAKYANDHLALTVGAFLGGVTSKPGSRPSPSDIVTDDGVDGELSLRVGEGGIGLRALRRAAIDLLGGRIQYASGHDRLIMTRYVSADGAMPRNTYKVVIKRSPKASWNAIGNHLQVSVPFVRPASAA